LNFTEEDAQEQKSIVILKIKGMNTHQLAQLQVALMNFYSLLSHIRIPQFKSHKIYLLAGSQPVLDIRPQTR
jgi:hypothetical protein